MLIKQFSPKFTSPLHTPDPAQREMAQSGLLSLSTVYAYATIHCVTKKKGTKTSVCGLQSPSRYLCSCAVQTLAGRRRGHVW